MKRREFIALFGAAAFATPTAVRAQQPGLPVIGVLYSVSAAQWVENMAGFRQGLDESGFVEGRNVAIEYRWAEGHVDRVPAMAADLIGRKVAVILVGGSIVGVRATMDATRSIPIVFTTGTDPVTTGLVASLNHPGGNVTGATFMGGQLIPKRLELLHEVLPAATRIAVLVNPTNPTVSESDANSANEAAARLGMQIIVVRASTEPEIDKAFAVAVEQRAAALTFDEGYLISRLDRIAALALRHGLPVVAGEHAAVTTGVLMSYGASTPDTYRQAGVYVGRILKGEKPANLPVLQPTKFKLVVNLKTAQVLGLKVPEAFLVRADEVIE
jgi:putative ABC transport system substrate-binding protein